MLKFRITGTTEIAKALQGLPSRVSKNIAIEAMAEAVRPLVNAAKAYSHRSIRTGALHRSIGFAVRQYKKGLVTYGVIGARRGFGVPDAGSSTGTTEPANYAHLVEYGHAIAGDANGWVDAQPFMRPAWMETRGDVAKILGRSLGEGVEREAEKISMRNKRSETRARRRAVALGAPII